MTQLNKEIDARRCATACTRRQFLYSAGLGVTFGALRTDGRETVFKREDFVTEDNKQSAEKMARQGRLRARFTNASKEVLEPDQHSLQIEAKREALLYIPAELKNAKAAPLALMLHGAGGNAGHGIALLKNFADRFGIVLLAPKSRRGTWDVIAENYGADVKFIDRALEYVFERCKIDAKRVAVGGFSDGASYGLSLGIINGELFTHVIAFSPGFMALTGQTGAPRIFISHGKDDRVLPIERCSRKIVPLLKRAQYDVTYQEFDGAHTIPAKIAEQAVEWFVRTR